MIENFIPSADFIIGGIVVGLTVAGIRTYLNRRRLYLIVPRLFSYSELSSTGQVIELTILNKGARTEEDVQVKLAPNLNYDVVASTLPGLEIDKNGLIKIERLSKSEDVSIVLNVDSGEFNLDSVLSVSSKEAKGEIKKKLEESENNKPSEIAFAVLVVFIIMPFFGYIFGTFFVKEIWPVIDVDTKAELKIIGERTKEKDKLLSEGWENIDRFVSSKNYASFNGNWPITVNFPKREGNILKFKIEFSNKSDKRTEFTASTSSAFDPQKSKNKNDWRHNRFELGILLLPDSSTSRTIEAYVPFNSKPKLVVFDFTIEVDTNAYRLNYVWNYKHK